MLKQTACVLFFFTLLGARAESPIELAKRGLAAVEAQVNPPLKRLVAEARLNFYVGRYSTSSSEKEAAFTRGLELARKALEVDSHDPDALLWSAVNDGQAALMRGKLAALFSVRRMVQTLTDLKAIAPSHDHFAADRILGALYLAAPAVISIGSVDKAREHFEAALKGAPQYPANQALYAHFLWETGDKEKAKRLAREVIQSQELEKYPLEAPDWKEALEPIFSTP